MNNLKYQAIVMGGSAGSMAALAQILPVFPAAFSLPIIVVQHLHPLQDDFFAAHFDSMCSLTVKEAQEKESIRAGYAYFAPANYHLLIEDDKTFALSVDEKVNFARPSIDVLFESAAEVYAPNLIGVILTGANNDGAQGLRAIKQRGGLAVVQDPRTAEVAFMPKAAIQAARADHVLSLADIGRLLLEKGGGGVNEKLRPSIL